MRNNVEEENVQEMWEEGRKEGGKEGREELGEIVSIESKTIRSRQARNKGREE